MIRYFCVDYPLRVIALEWESCAVWPRTGWCPADGWTNGIIWLWLERAAAEQAGETQAGDIYIQCLHFINIPHIPPSTTPPGPLSPLHWRAQGPVCVATVMSIRACQRGDKINKQCEGEHCDALFHSLVHLCLRSKPVCHDVVRQTVALMTWSDAMVPESVAIAAVETHQLWYMVW